MTTTTEVNVPDIGDFGDVPVIEVHVAAGDHVNADDPLITLESDKATMDVPAPAAGTVAELRVKVGDKVGEGSPILLLRPATARSRTPPSLVEQQEPARPRRPRRRRPSRPAARPPPPRPPRPAGPHPGRRRHRYPGRGGARRPERPPARPASSVSTWPRSPATGPKGRITKDDLLAFLQGPAQPAAAPAAAAAGSGIPAIPAVDFSKFGPVEPRPLPRIKKMSGPFLHRSWLNVPHVTHHDEADITELDGYRKQLDTAAKADRPYRVTLLAFLSRRAWPR